MSLHQHSVITTSVCSSASCPVGPFGVPAKTGCIDQSHRRPYICPQALCPSPLFSWEPWGWAHTSVRAGRQGDAPVVVLKGMKVAFLPGQNPSKYHFLWTWRENPSLHFERVWQPKSSWNLGRISRTLNCKVCSNKNMTIKKYAALRRSFSFLAAAVICRQAESSSWSPSGGCSVRFWSTGRKNSSGYQNTALNATSKGVSAASWSFYVNFGLFNQLHSPVIATVAMCVFILWLCVNICVTLFWMNPTLTFLGIIEFSAIRVLTAETTFLIAVKPFLQLLDCWAKTQHHCHQSTLTFQSFS